MGLSLRYRFAPELDPNRVLSQPQIARGWIAAAAAAAAAALEKERLPFQAEPCRHQIRDTPGGVVQIFEARLLLGGPAQGCEPLSLGWRCYAPEPWSGEQFLKTQYARHFLTAHPALCRVLQALARQGWIDRLHDEAGHYPGGQSPEQLAAVYARSMAQAGQVHDLLQSLGAGYQAPTPGGAVKDFGPPPG